MRPFTPTPAPTTNDEQCKTGLADPRALDILTTEHWSLLSTRSLGYQEVFNRATIFVAVVSASVVALALLAQATRFGSQVLWFALLLLSVALFIGLATFVRSVWINFEDARLLSGMNLLRHAYLTMVPELEPFFITGHDREGTERPLAHGAHQRMANLVSSLTTTSGLVAALNSILAGALAGDLVALVAASRAGGLVIAAATSLLSAALHVRYAARSRRRHSAEAPGLRPASPVGGVGAADLADARHNAQT